ncbi:MAG: blue light sensor protein [Polaromonas sp.]|nr:blue light sensor protein [Polaromonas sp.]
METPPRLFEILYVSTLAPQAPVSIVAEIANRARNFNEAHGISGLLIFDGLRFCQQLEGSQKQVLALLERIRQDPRHVDVEVLHHAPLAERRFRRFSLGFTMMDDADLLGSLEKMDGLEALEGFLALQPCLDIGA